MNIGNVSILDLRVGGIPVQSAYDGEHLVWTRESPAGDYWGLCFTAKEANSTVAMSAETGAPAVTLEYSTNANDWSPFTVGSTTVTLARVGDKVWLRAGSGGNSSFCSTSNKRNNFVLTGKVAASGNIMSILDGEQQLTNIPATYCFTNLFFGCTSLVTPPELPATSLANYCYSGMFQNCTSLSVAPELPATTLTQRCYDLMFLSCTSLSVAPELPATTLANNCYDGMFVSCYSLTQAPQLPGNMVGGCYASMFRSCTNLQTPPSALFGASTGSNGCIQMFEDCSSLTSMPDIQATTAGSGGMFHMFYRCSNLTKTTPIRVTKSSSSGMSYMFNGCSKLSSIEVEFTSWPGNTSDWVYNVAPNGIFKCPEVLGTNDTIMRGRNNCPNGWTVVNPTYIRFTDNKLQAYDWQGQLTQQEILDAHTANGYTYPYIRELSVGGEITSIGPSALIDCKGQFHDVRLGPNVETLEVEAFRRCQVLSTFDFGNAPLTSIGNWAMGGIQRTYSYALPSTLVEIGDNAFGYNSYLSSIYIPSSVTSIGTTPWQNCSQLLSVVFLDRTIADVEALNGYPWGVSGKITVSSTI